MKKLLLSAILFVVLNSLVFAQTEDSEKALKTANKAYSAYNLDPAGNKSKLDEAQKAIDIACASEPGMSSTKAWTTRGQIYAEFANQDEIAVALKKISKLQFPDAPLVAYKSFRKAYDLAVKKWEKSDATKGISELINKLRNAGADKFAEKNYKVAYETFTSVIDANQLLKSNGEKNVLDDNTLNTYVYYAALSAQNAEMYPQAEALFENLRAAKFELKESPGAVYSGLYNVLSAQKKEAEAIKVLEDGVKMYPNDTELLFAQINHYLKNNKLSELIDKLKTAIAKEPKNAGLYSTLGGVYDNLSQIESKNGNMEKSDEYIKSAESYYSQSLAIEPNNFDATYSLGAMYYNKAASLNAELIKLQDDYSNEGTKKYEALKAKMNSTFADALPYFKKAEVIDPNDRNTLTAIREIYVRQGDLKMGDEFKKRQENVDKNIKNTSYFKN